MNKILKKCVKDKTIWIFYVIIVLIVMSSFLFIVFFNNGKQVKNIKGKGEVFFSIKHRIPESDGKWSYGLSKYGYIIVTPGMREIFNTLFQDRKENMYIDLIE